MSGKKVVLLVDDEANVLLALERALRREGYTLLTARSAAEALRILSQQRVDALVSDHKMPGRSGLELLREVRAKRPEVRGTLMTGWAEDLDASQLAALGIGAPIAKPWEDADLKSALRGLLAGP